MKRTLVTILLTIAVSSRLGGILAANDSLARVVGQETDPLWEADTGGTQDVASRPKVIGVGSGDVTSSSAVIWARASRRAHLRVQYDVDPNFSRPRTARLGRVDKGTDFTAQGELHGLQPNTAYYYRVWASGRPASGLAGRFKTAPNPSQAVPLSFTVGGDLGGQGYCRRVNQGYTIFSAMLDLAPDFHNANGDGIYADGTCPREGPITGWENIPGDFPSVSAADIDWTDAALVREIILAHYHYNWDDPHFQAFHRAVPVYAQWDDHEAINDFGLPWDYWNPDTINRPGFPNVAQQGLRAFHDYWPVAHNPDKPGRIYRSIRWGADVELFFLDERSYRDRNDLPDTPENQKTLLGAEQLAWLKEGLLNSTATWKLVFNDVPLCIPTGTNAANFGHDGWAKGTGGGLSRITGFERELLDLVGFLDANRVRNIVWFSTDVHYARTIRYSLDADGDGEPIEFHEFICGPLSAVRGSPGALSPTLKPTSLYQEGNLFNFGYYRVLRGTGGESHFVADIRDESGQVRPGSTFDLVAN